MKVVYKYPLNLDGTNLIPYGKIVHVGTQWPGVGNDTVDPVIWVEHPIDVGTEVGHGFNRMDIQIFGTGHHVPDDCTHQGSVVLVSSGLVWHVYLKEVMW
jgi:hypothetical protein